VSLSKLEIAKYDRHIRLNEVGLEGQVKLKKSSVLIIGAGGLGCPVIQYLVAAGVGKIGIIDGDDIDASNLQRQILFNESDIGENKAQTAAKKMRALNSVIEINAYDEFLSTNNAVDYFKQYDIIVDGSDNFGTRYLVNDACIICSKPLVFGSIFKFEGQVSVFNYQNGPSYRCLYPEAPEEGTVPNCSEIGVIGVLPGFIGTVMANECIKMILGIGKVMSGTLSIYNLLDASQFQLKITRNESNFGIKELQDDYNIDCAIENDEMMKSITPTELNKQISRGESYQIIDVREPMEFNICSIPNSQLISLGTIDVRKDEINKSNPTVMVCHHGMRSARVIQYLEQFGYNNLINLEGGIHAWALEVDQNMATY